MGESGSVSGREAEPASGSERDAESAGFYRQGSERFNSLV